MEAETEADCVDIDVAAAEWMEVGNSFLQMTILHNLALASAAVAQRQVVEGEEQPYHQSHLVGAEEVGRIHIQTASAAA